MAKVSPQGYILRGRLPKKEYNWFLVKNNYRCNTGYVIIDRHYLNLPKQYIGKRIQIKLEVQDECDNGNRIKQKKRVD